MKNINENLWQKVNYYSSFAIILLCAVSPSFCGGFEFSYTLPISFVLLACIFINLTANKDRTHSVILYTGSFFVLLAMLLMCIFSSNVYLSLENIILFGTAILLTFASANIFRDRKKLLLFAFALVAVCGIISLIMFRNTAIMAGGGALFREKLAAGTLDRIFGTFINPNFYAAYLSMVFPISLSLIFIMKETKYALLWGLFSVFILINLCLTGSKFGFIALFFGIIVMIICLFITKSFTKQTVRTIIAVSAVCIIFLALFSGTLISRVESAGTTQVHSAEFRIYTWKAALNMIKANPLIGVFPGRFSEAYPQYTIASLTKHAHSSYLQFASEYGVILYIVFLAGIFLILCNIPKIRENCNTDFRLCHKDRMGFLYSGFAGGLVSALVHNLADSDLYICSILFIFALLCGFLLSFVQPADTPLFLRHRFSNIPLIYLLGCLWILLSVIMFMRQDYADSYKIFPNNYMALRELASNDPLHSAEYLQRAAVKAPKDYISYQLLGDSFYMDNPTSETSLVNYEKALKLHPHSTLNMIRICNWALYNSKTDIAEKYYRKILDQENSAYEQLKGIPELVNTDYCEAHIFFGDKYLAEGNAEKAEKHFLAATGRYEKWLSPENSSFHIVSLFSGQKSKQNYEDNIRNCTETYRKLEKIQHKSYSDKINTLEKNYSDIIKEMQEMTK